MTILTVKAGKRFSQPNGAMIDVQCIVNDVVYYNGIQNNSATWEYGYRMNKRLLEFILSGNGWEEKP